VATRLADGRDRHTWLIVLLVLLTMLPAAYCLPCTQAGPLQVVGLGVVGYEVALRWLIEETKKQ